MSVYQHIAANTFKTYVVMAMFIALLTALGAVIGLSYNDPIPFVLFAAGFSIVSAVGSYWFSDKIVLASVHAVPADKKTYFDYYTVTENIALAAGIPMPRLYVIHDEVPNAFATGRNPNHAVVCATTGLLSRLERAEIEGVVAHELSHIKNYDTLLMTITAVLAGTIATLADMFLRVGTNIGGRKRNPLLLALVLLSLIIAPLAATLIQLSISRQREYLADASAVLLTRYPEGLARALEKISAVPQPLRHAPVGTAHLWIADPTGKKGRAYRFIESLFATHPPIQERVQALRSM